MDWLYDPQIWLSLVSLSVLEIVLGIDNLVFLAILTDRLPEDIRPLAERLGLAFALLARRFSPSSTNRSAGATSC